MHFAAVDIFSLLMDFVFALLTGKDLALPCRCYVVVCRAHCSGVLWVDGVINRSDTGGFGFRACLDGFIHSSSLSFVLGREVDK